MPKRPVSKEQWEALVEAFRSAPGNINAAHKTTKLDYHFCRRAWDKGISWASFPEAREPISVVISGEAERQRVALVRQESTTKAIRQDAQRDAAETRIAEAQMVRLARASTTGLLASLVRISTGAAQVGDAVADSIQALGAVKDEQGNPRMLTMPEVSKLVSLLSRVGQTLRQVTEAASKVIESERVVLGEPTHVLGIVHKVEDLTQEEADRRIAAAMRALERAKQQGLFATEPARAKVIDVTPEPKPSG